jgi:hypothetical protein
MAYVPGFHYNFFVSYASEYNSEGDITRFVEDTLYILSHHLGRGFNADHVFFDREQLGNATNVSWRQKIEQAASGSALLVPLLSPGYRDSPACRDELSWFRASQILRPADSQGFCPVLWWETSLRDFPADLQAAQVHSFVGSLGQPHRPGSPEWKTSVGEFALKLANALRALRHSCGGIYVGYAPPSAEAVRDNVIREIEKAGYRTVAESEIPEAKLALHFLGSQPLDRLVDIEQCLLNCPGETIVFLPPQATLLAEEQTFLEEVENDLQSSKRLAGKRYHRLEASSPTQLVDYIRDCLSRVREAEQVPTVAIPCEKSDIEEAMHLAARIKECGFQAACPDFLLNEPSIVERIKKFKNLFLRSEALLYYWAKADGKSLANLRARARESQRQFRAEAWFVAPPDSPEKRTLPTGQIIRQRGNQLDPEALQELSAFVSSLRAGARS